MSQLPNPNEWEVRTVELNMDQNLKLLALQEMLQILLQLHDEFQRQGELQLRDQARSCLVRLSYFLRHSGLDRELAPYARRALEAFQCEHQARALDRCLSLVPEQLRAASRRAK